MNIKNSLVSIFALVILLIISFFTYQKYSTQTVSYNGLGESAYGGVNEVKKDITIKNEKVDSDKIEFTQRKITGGGINPGWVISLVETQPNIFTGRVIVDDGVYQHPVTLKEEVNDIFIGEMKSVSGNTEVFAMKKINKSCTDSEGNLFQYNLSGSYGATNFAGCGGDLIKAVE